jgi:Uma2 family endonuclease
MDEYLALLKVGDGCYEYEDGDILAMAGTPEHSRISDNIFGCLFARLAGGGCRVFSMQTAVLTPQWEPFRFPAAFIVCGTPEYEMVDGVAAVKNPTVVFEVLSPGTEGKDRNRKRQAYFAISSLEAYVLLDQFAPTVTIYTRSGDRWERSDVLGLEAEIEVAGIRLALSELYEGVEFR